MNKVMNIIGEINVNISPSNDTSSEKPSPISDLSFLGYYSLVMVILGTILNLLTLSILFRPVFRNTQARPALHYMRTIAVIDLLGLYGWNLDNYFGTVHGFTLNNSYTIASCKFFSFFNYFILDVAAWLRVFVSLDRYLSLSRLQRNTWFNRPKSVLIIINSTIVFFILFNFHFLPFVCYRDGNGNIVRDSTIYSVYPTFNTLQFVTHTCIPCLLMISLNSLSIYHLIRLRYTTLVQNSRVPHRAISVALVVSTWVFLVTYTPSAVNYC